MSNSVPTLFTMMNELLSEISVSSTSAQWDTGNRKVIDKLAGWLSALGFKCEVIPLQGKANKANLITGCIQLVQALQFESKRISNPVVAEVTKHSDVES